ncbi:MAG TPA: MerR family transcriptional regulator [Bacteroidales bacterium]|nr:MerR family transcriptional regulator [Bacteroidales bacterium]
MATYSIKDMEKLSGIKAHTIRIWEKRYSLICPSRTNTNIRLYSDAELRKLLNISILVRNGMRISQISRLPDSVLGEKVAILAQTTSKIEDLSEGLISAMIEFDENKFDRILSNLIIKFGFEDTYIKVLTPFFEKVGILWQTGTILPAQEHFVSSLIRQKLIIAIDSQRDVPITRKSNFLLFLPEGEMHELGLLFIQYLLRKRGYSTVYLGQNVPMDNFPGLSEKLSVDVLVTSFTLSSVRVNAEKIVRNILLSFPHTKVILTGLQIKNFSFQKTHNVHCYSHVHDFIQAIEVFD